MNVCRKHFDELDVNVDYEKRLAIYRACPDCRRAEQAYREQLQERDTIVPWAPYGKHIALTCEAHPHLRWHTKNIAHIGARSIFYSGHVTEECKCDARLLRPVGLHDRLMDALDEVNRTAPQHDLNPYGGFALDVAKVLFTMAWTMDYAA